jgi:hypothetical protein
MEKLGSHWTNFNQIWCLIIFENLSSKLKIYRNLTRITCTLHEDKNMFEICISCLIRLRMKMFQTKVLEKLETHIIYSIHVSPENRAVYEKCGSVLYSGSTWDDNVAHALVSNATNKHIGCVILVFFIFHGNNGCTTCLNVKLPLPVLHIPMLRKISLWRSHGQLYSFFYVFLYVCWWPEINYIVCDRTLLSLSVILFFPLSAYPFQTLRSIFYMVFPFYFFFHFDCHCY